MIFTCLSTLPTSKFDGLIVHDCLIMATYLLLTCVPSRGINFPNPYRITGLVVVVVVLLLPLLDLLCYTLKLTHSEH